MYEGFRLDSLCHIRLLPWTRSLAQACSDTIPPASPLLHPRSAPFKPSSIATEKQRRVIRQHHGLQLLQYGCIVWYSSGLQTTSVRSFTVTKTPRHPSDGRSSLEKA